MTISHRIKASAFSALFFLLMFSDALIAQEKLPIQTTDLLNIKQISNLTISPDGKNTVYVVRSITGENGKYSYQNQLWMVPSDGSAPPRQLTFSDEGASQPAWHSDGARIAFTRSVEGKPQIHVLPLSGGEAIPYTDIPNGASSPSWSPDGRHLLFSVSYSHQDLLKSHQHKNGPAWPHEKPGRSPYGSTADPDPDGGLDEIRAWLDKNERERSPTVLNRLNFQGEFNLNPERSYSHLYVMPDQPLAEPRALTSGYFGFSNAAWMPDGRTIIMTGNMQTDEHPDRTMESALYRTTVSADKPERYVYRAGFSYAAPVPSPNGRYIAFRSFDMGERGYNQAEIGILDTRNGEISIHGKTVDRSLGNLKWSHDSRFVYAVAPTDGGFPLYRLNVGNRRFERLSPLETGIRDFDIHSNRIVYVKTDIENPFELYHADAAMNGSRRISDHNHHWVSNRSVSRPTAHTVTTDDGFEIQYWVMEPHGLTAGETYPTVLQIHGGPSAMWGPGEASMWHEFQLFTAHGFGVVYSNPRGSGGYGYGFQKGNHRDWGFGPMKDVLASLDDAAERHPWIDGDRLTVTGGSYGGYLVAFIIGNDHRFKAAAAQRGVYELTTFLGEGNAWRLIPDRFDGYPWEDGMAELLGRESPMTYAHQITAPLLILHGDNDLRTGVSQSEMLYRTLKILERDVEYIRYPQAGHDLSRTGNPHHRMDRLLRMIEFMKRYVD